MPDDVTTDNESEYPSVDAEAWEIAFEAYSEHPTAAYRLARHLTAVKRFLETQPPNVSHAAAALEEACESLFRFTQFRDAGYDLFRVAIEGHATRAQENLMESMGISY